MMPFRFLQGASAGAGMVVGRAIIRDCVDGPAVQKMMARVILIFGIAPLAAPVMGGFLLNMFGWRSIFAFMLSYAVVIFIWAWLALPETHPVYLRRTIAPALLFANYVQVIRRRDFRLLVGAVAFNFAGIFIYIASAPIFLIHHLGVSTSGFAWLFVPGIGGIMLGSFLSARMINRWSSIFLVRRGHQLMLLAAAANIALSFILPPQLPLSIVPIFFYALGMSLTMPSLTSMLLDLSASLRGTASSLQTFFQNMLSVISAGVMSLLVSSSTKTMAITMACMLIIGCSCWLSFNRCSDRN